MTILRNRILASMNLATGTDQFAPQQSFFIETNADGRWAANGQTTVHAPAYIHRRHPDGTCDTISCRPTVHYYQEDCGKGARDVAAGRI
jgi:hypothetical protein